MADFGIPPAALSRIAGTLRSFDSVKRAVVFGSRANGTHKRYSDIDICLFGDIDAFGAERVRGALDDLNVIYEFDVVAYGEIKSTALRDRIDREGIEIAFEAQRGHDPGHA